MLGKLLKYDFKETSRLLLPIYAGLLIISLFGKLMLATNLYTSIPDALQILTIFTYILLIIACCMGAPIYFIVYFYRSLYSDKGYVMHTLPVTTHQKLFSKLITSFVMELLTFAVCFLSVLIILYERESFAWLSRVFQSAAPPFLAATDMHFSTFIILTLILLLISLLSQLLMYYASISLGQLFGGHRVLGAIAAYMGLNFISQIISSIILIVLSVGSMDTYALMTGRTIIALYGLTGCLNLLLALGYYMICYYIMEKKLNLN